MSQQEAIAEGIRNALKELVLSEEDFRGGRPSMAHRKTVNTIGDAWRRTRGFEKSDAPFSTVEIRPVGGGWIDFVGRKTIKGQILLALEVDTEKWFWEELEKSWTKLADVNAIVKVWVHITGDDSEEALRQYFDEVKERMGYFLRNFGGVKPGEIFVFYKTPSHLFEARLP